MGAVAPAWPTLEGPELVSVWRFNRSTRADGVSVIQARGPAAKLLGTQRALAIPASSRATSFGFQPFPNQSITDAVGLWRPVLGDHEVRLCLVGGPAVPGLRDHESPREERRPAGHSAPPERR